MRRELKTEIFEEKQKQEAKLRQSKLSKKQKEDELDKIFVSARESIGDLDEEKKLVDTR